MTTLNMRDIKCRRDVSTMADARVSRRQSADAFRDIFAGYQSRRRLSAARWLSRRFRTRMPILL